MFWNIVLILIHLLGNCLTGMRMKDLTRASLSIKHDKPVSVIGFLDDIGNERHLSFKFFNHLNLKIFLPLKYRLKT